MRTRSLAAITLSLSIIGLTGRADAAGAWVASAPLTPVEQRVAIAAGPLRTTIWTSLRFTQQAAGSVAIVVPAPPGSALDLSSDAWFEALEVATAPRVFPPVGAESACPGAPPSPPALFEIAGHVEHMQSLKVEDVSVLDDAAAVSSWASQAGLTISPALDAALGSQGPGRFVALRFQAPAGPSITPTLRLSMPGAPPLLPLALLRAGSDDLQITTFLIGEGRAKLSGTVDTSVPSLGLRWDAAAKKSDYLSDRESVLDLLGPSAALLESAGHEALGTSLPIANGKASIDSVLVSFFERASAYGDAEESVAGCSIQAALALASNSAVASVCPRAYLGVIDGGAPCKESPSPVGVDPAELRCGGIADDLAVALSDLTPSQTWLNRQTMHIPAGNAGANWYLSFVPGEALSPVRIAASLDLSGCQGGSSSSSSSGGNGNGNGNGAGSSSSGTVTFEPDAGSSSSSGSYGSGPYDDGSGSIYVDPSVTIDTTSCNCAGTSDTAVDSGGNGCDGSSDTSGAVGSCDGSASDGSADSCSGDSAGSSGCDGSSGGGDMDCGSSGGGSDMSCSGGGGGDVECSILGAGLRRARAPKLSVMAMLAAALLAPLRRCGRKTRGAAARAKE
ncbi:MAG: DUF2330 domain-containing protein [Minicystis sp.]